MNFRGRTTTSPFRGELIYTRPESGEVVNSRCQSPAPTAAAFSCHSNSKLKGEIPREHLRHFVALDLRRQGSHCARSAI